MKYGMIAVTADDLIRVNHTLPTAPQYPAAAGGGYVAGMLGTHQLHCLHFLWQDHHRGLLPDVELMAEQIPEMYERHYEHCVDYIRQGLMCNFDTGLLTFDWVLDHPNPTPNGNTPHKCVNWDVLQLWLEEQAVEIPEAFKWEHPEGQESLSWNP
jgi:hypothetical protein